MNNRSFFQKSLLVTVVMLVQTFSLYSQNTSYNIRINQVGFLPNSIKRAAVVNSQADSFRVMTSAMDATVYKGQFLPSVNWAASGEDVKIADFTLLKSPGRYVIVVDGLGKSVPFSIGDRVFTDISKASIKAFYYNRASMPILSEYAGKYARKEGHPDTAVIVLPSAASANRPAGTVISTPGGWYDAGDYNKYIVNSGISTFTLLSAYETYPAYYDTLSLNIPESGNNIPDILDEALWNIKWMMTMQDEDGGVYNKTTEAQFGAFAMPDQFKNTKRYVCAKGTAAALDFAAIMAMTSRIYRKYDPELADKALDQAVKAWAWAKANPKVAFNNPSASGGYPAIGTGGYGDSNFSDEFSWCAAELYISTKDPAFYSDIKISVNSDLPGWGNVRTLGLLSLVVNRGNLTSEADTVLIKNRLVNQVSNSLGNIITSAYRIPGDFFYWGGNNAYANWGMLYLQAFRLTGNASYFNGAVSVMDYLLGRNATSYCFVTGAGTKSPKNIHHRISGADGIPEPVPGLLVGGPNPSDVSDCGASSYPSKYAAKSYLDQQCSYSTNEIAINWNAPLAFLTGALQYEYLVSYKDTMLGYFSISLDKVSLSYKKGNDVKAVIEGNTSWSLSPTADWIYISAKSGDGTSTIQINSTGDNPLDTIRTGKIYVYSNTVLVDSILISQNGVRKSFKLEAEDYNNMLGVQKEATTDTGGGENLAYVDPGDWTTYNIDITVSGIYNVVFRHAGYAGDIDIYVDDTFVKNITFAKTADWQVWDSYTAQIELTEGQHVLKLNFKATGINLNWLQFDWASPLSNKTLSSSGIVKVYPNPAETYLNIDFNAEAESGEIRLLSVEGKTLARKVISGDKSVTIDVSGLSKGVYVLKINTGKEMVTEKVVVR